MKIMFGMVLGVKSTGGAAQTAESGQHSLPRPPTTPRPTTPSSCGASQPATVPGAEEITLRLDCHRPTTGRLAADGFRYKWEEFVAYYREDAPAMWRVAWQRELRMAVVPRLILIRWLDCCWETSQDCDDIPDVVERPGDDVWIALFDGDGA